MAKTKKAAAARKRKTGAKTAVRTRKRTPDRSRADIDRGHEQWLAAMKANDAKALGPLVTADAVLMPPNQSPVVSRQGVIDWFAGVVRQARTTGVSVPQREVTIAGDLAIERGSFTWTVAPTSGGSPIEDRGNFLAIWQRQKDGSWQVTRNIWNSTRPAAMATST